MEWKTTWLQIVRQACILIDPDHLIINQFTTSTALQKWIDISYTITDKDATPLLHKAIRNEIDRGLGSLPTNLFDSYFQLQASQLLKLSGVWLLSLIFWKQCRI